MCCRCETNPDRHKHRCGATTRLRYLQNHPGRIWWLLDSWCVYEDDASATQAIFESPDLAEAIDWARRHFKGEQP
jgi:hypothetical protein